MIGEEEWIVENITGDGALMLARTFLVASFVTSD
jgi:hypothetical protein